MGQRLRTLKGGISLTTAIFLNDIRLQPSVRFWESCVIRYIMAGLLDAGHPASPFVGSGHSVIGVAEFTT